ncbi:MAG: phosphoenolpyruvate--protein phosphotransferase, partial [Thermoguttaceae bacterium]|nr:phosphoenolpyruvate--protein phosphotransferase [Thermoguttaceae bacterium]
NFILVGYDISPVDTLSLDLNRITGIVSECGGLTSHVAILAQTRGIPAVVSVSNFLNNIRNNDMICLDGRNGIVVIHPDDSTIKYYRQMAENELRERESNVEDTFPEPEPAFPVFANIGGLDDVEFALKYGAKGVGLFRTEFLLCDRELPDEETQFNIYREVLERINGPVIVRTFDIGGDKLFSSLNLPAEPNPFLGNRGSRLYRDFPQLVQSQLRALLRASVYGDLRVMFPMIDTVEEVVFLKELVQQAREQLLNENVPLDEVPLGIMIETPAAVLIMNDLAPLVDFFSIGTNDLTQYTLAVDRGNKNVANLYNPFHPAVLQLIKMAIDTAHQYHKEIGMCGEFAGNPDAVPYLVDFGLDEWSVVPSKIPVIRERLRNCHL